MKTRVFAVCAVFLLFCSIVHAGLSDGLVAYYPFNGNTSDESGNGNNGIVNGATLTTDRFGKANSAYSFNGTNNSIQANINTRIGDVDITVSAWVKLGNQQYGMWDGHVIAAIAGKGYAGYITGYGLGVVDNKAEFQARILSNVEYVDSSNTINDNKWHHLAGIMRRNDVKGIVLYIDGIEQYGHGNPTLLTSSLDNNYPFMIGTVRDSYGHDSYYFNGLIDDIRFYNRALSASEVQQLYQSQGTCSSDIVTFTAGTPAKAADVNANFYALNCQIQALKAIVCKNEPTASVCQ
jgi:hypothetical protein